MNNDQDLLLRAKRFDSSSLTTIYDQYSPLLYRYACRLLGDPILAEECLAETFKRFLQAIKKGGGPGTDLKAYLYRIAHNWITDHYRKKQDDDLGLSDEVEDLKSNVDAEIGHKHEFDDVRKALMCLTAEQRQVIVLRFIEEYENEEIAKVLNKSEGSIKALQHRALAALRRQLDHEGR